MSQLSLIDGLQAGGAPVMWERVFQDALPAIRKALPPGSSVLELGYGDGLLSCFLCRELGWTWTGLDIRPEARQQTESLICLHNLADRMTPLLCEPHETRQHTGQYDGVFIKTVIYTSTTLEEYRRWLDWIVSVLKPGGHMVNFETGRANGLVQLYRGMRGRPYTDLRLYTSQEERAYDERFEILFRRYYGGFSQFLAPLPPLYRLASKAEEAVSLRRADNCFVVSMIGCPRQRGNRSSIQ